MFQRCHGSIATVSLSDYIVSTFLHQTVLIVKFDHKYIDLFIYVYVAADDDL